MVEDMVKCSIVEATRNATTKPTDTSVHLSLGIDIHSSSDNQLASTCNEPGPTSNLPLVP